MAKSRSQRDQKLGMVCRTVLQSRGEKRLDFLRFHRFGLTLVQLQSQPLHPPLSGADLTLGFPLNDFSADS